MIIDFKAHIMPGMDKTCKSRIDTIRRLMAAKDAGVDVIVASPVYDPDECGVEEFLDRRRQSQDILDSLMNEELPEVMPAAMVRYRDSLLSADGLEKLCFGDKCFLLSIEDDEWDETTEAVLRRLSGKLGMSVIIATSAEVVLKHGEKLQQLGVHILLELDDVHHKKQIRALLPFIANGLICAIGSDWDSESPYRFLRKAIRRMDAAFDTVMCASAKLLGK